MAHPNERIRILLDRNIFISPKVKAELLSADKTKQLEILPMLEDMDKEQTEAFRRRLDRNPNLFEDWGNAIEAGIKKSD